jgi:alkylation response protein AidB-like acyl-CoA dehydrogenase
VSDVGAAALVERPHEEETDAESFTAECRRFFADVPVKVDKHEPLAWGQGSDRVALFESPDRAVQEREITELRAWRRRLFDAGLGWITGPVALGGRGLTRSYERIFDSFLRRHEVPSSSPLTISLGMVAPTILTHGSAATKERYLQRLYNGELIACQLFSEPGAGSDLPAMTTRAERDGDGWRLDGQKVWTSGAHFADIGILVARTREDPRHHNLTTFLIDMHQPGVEVRPLRQMTGGAAFNEVFLNSAWVPDEDRLGEVHDGWRVALTTLSNERGAIGGPGFGGVGIFNMDRYKMLVLHFGKQDDPIVRQAFVSMYTHLWAAKVSRQRAAESIRSGVAPGPEASIGKLVLAQNFERVSAFVSLVVGPALIADNGDWGTYAWSELVLGAPGYRIGGGTDEIVRNGLAERVLGLPKDPAPTEGPNSKGAAHARG